ncbi:restriction endonuclease [Paenibacillus sp. MER 180]|uniref:restriction endonuclease n=1 Tax=Paenibacillus sp. MER 180 TaxID=2939570 RepID=UPI00203F2489|nr:restriction endonuclease [Paenibacillus sp. MER 180]MCM3292152.1 restriction endonuclease [Paenibacillus sp. MER 180]
MGSSEWMLIAAVMIAMLLGASILVAIQGKKPSKKNGRLPQNRAKRGTTNRASTRCREDEAILSSKLEDLTGAEFERLWALYFRDQGYGVTEVGVGGSDGGVDLVITDRRGEKTAVQAKCYASHHKVPVQTVRELVGAKRNHDCILSLLITTSDLTGPAKKEAEQFKVDYWHGALIEHKLRSWGKWNPGKRTSKKSSREMEVAKAELKQGSKESAASASKTCTCGSPMVRRKSKQGQAFWGCSTYPKCRHTRSV